MLKVTETINSELILTGISQNNRHYLSKLDIFDLINSTNTYLLQQINQKAPSGWVCLANQQSFGRGRQEKIWYSPPGNNIYCSLFWRFKQLPTGLGIGIAIMLARKLKKYLPTIQIKWPNDLWVNGKKLGGILLEAKTPKEIVIGIGINLSLSTDTHTELPQAISFDEITQQPIKRNECIGLILDTLFSELPYFEEEGLNPFIKDWEEFDVLKDKNIVVFTPKMAAKGIMRGINSAGELMLEDDVGLLRNFCYGEVSVRC
jgi:BirA family biotin operon repressor/biotin-[acetyl-CoA-carboxylase] ligase